MPSPVCLAPTKSISTSAVGEYSSDGLPSRLRLAPTKNISASAVGGHRADCLPQRTERVDEEKASLPASLFLPKKAVGGERFAVLDERNA